ncbi:VIT1/CCC1 transporter family protein [Aspergillus clavatus NRRL 1]|uniref:Calcium transporter, putative n=1 Tax=Aspergillus clavatus (strain ATCC 1007 / CBS 513.65 / DSM 816 / NCTC 3887 / NRRL 1 / QM 1276 / 107) TaxID=344612 RepID=A1CIH6_ASPCL|nr:calcium transporter, putative [Aspergillus clavatus NRRL 1]EAW10681.1 calcium transporter, putative [Aspergillus clavatus NRRL 1]
MALLFLKQKLFPSKGKQAKPDRYGKPLLSPSDSDTLGSDADQDIEAQRSYSTFNTPRSDAESVSSNSSNSRSRINPRIISDAILGLSDGLTVPFALSAGLSALGNTKVVVLGGLAELAAGAISMGLGGYVGAKSEAESYQATVRETKELIETSSAETSSIVHNTFAAYGLPDDAISQINASLHASQERLLEFLVSFHHKESQPDCNQAWISAITLALGYFVGGFIPLIPYFIVEHVNAALYWSIGVMAITLLAFGYIKTCVVRGWTGKDNIIAAIKGGVQMCCVGGIAAGAAIALVRLIDQGAA